MMLPNAIAGAVSVVPQAAGAASGITGFTQMAIGAAAAQLDHHDPGRRHDADADAADDPWRSVAAIRWR